RIGILGVSGSNALAVAPSGLLYGATQTGDFFGVDSSTGRATVIGNFGSGLISQGDLAFGPDGTLVGAAYTSTGTSVLVTIDPATGHAVQIQSGVSIGFASVFGLAFVGSDLFGLAGGSG